MVSYPTVSPLSCGFLSPPAWKFVADAQDNQKITMPSLSFLIQHPASSTKIVFDLSIRKDRTKYHPELQKHIETRQPLSSENDVKSALAAGGIDAADIDYVILSHVHWDHIGTPSDFTSASFIVGHDTPKLLRNEMGPELYNPYFEADLLPSDRTIELAATPSSYETTDSQKGAAGQVFDAKRGWYWQPLAPIPHALDMFHDGTVFLIDSPGHSPGHLNALVRVAPDKWVYLAADSCHHVRILKGETDFGRWQDGQGRTVSIHHDIDAAYNTLNVIKQLRCNGLDGVPVEVVLAHDGDWEKQNAASFFPNHL